MRPKITHMVIHRTKGFFISETYKLHEAKVRVWLKETTTGMDASELIDHFEYAITVIWSRAADTVSDVTVAAVFDRVLTEAVHLHPCLALYNIQNGHLKLDKCRTELMLKTNEEIAQIMLFVFTEFLTILGNITAEVISNQMHKSLSQCQNLHRKDKKG